MADEHFHTAATVRKEHLDVGAKSTTHAPMYWTRLGYSAVIECVKCGTVLCESAVIWGGWKLRNLQ